MEKTSYAGFWVRFTARFIDGVVIAVAMTGLQSFMGSNTWSATITALVLSFGYFCFMTKVYGATLGKQAVGLKVVSDAGAHVPLSWWTVFVREVLGKVVSNAILDIGYLMVVWTAKKQSLHDKMARTVVLRHPERNVRVMVTIINIFAIALFLFVITASIISLRQ